MCLVLALLGSHAAKVADATPIDNNTMALTAETSALVDKQEQPVALAGEASTQGMGMCSGSMHKILQKKCQEAKDDHECDNSYFIMQGEKVKCGKMGRNCVAKSVCK